ncbi:hypothetical protein FRB93_003301 [Tulasnella sp. JGI-2019a]|nr:hypothetical protein FRB93_003301 [Tulasnella sp. JGI-2019a]
MTPHYACFLMWKQNPWGNLTPSATSTKLTPPLPSVPLSELSNATSMATIHSNCQFMIKGAQVN